jgi:hypothetical protein
LKTSLLYKTSSVLLVLFAIGHTIGFRKVDPQWQADSVVEAMRAVRFNVQGFSRTYWDFYVGFGLFVTLFFLLVAIWCWQLSVLNSEALQRMSFATWALAICFMGVTLLSWKCFFIAPVVFSSAGTVCLSLAAWVAGRTG